MDALPEETGGRGSLLVLVRHAAFRGSFPPQDAQEAESLYQKKFYRTVKPNGFMAFSFCECQAQVLKLFGPYGIVILICIPFRSGKKDKKIRPKRRSG